MDKNILSHPLLFLFILIITQCISPSIEELESIRIEKPEDIITKTTPQDSSEVPVRLPNPYSLSNMQYVLSSHGQGVRLSPTHLHVCFHIQSWDQYYSLFSDYDFELFPFPLDINPDMIESYEETDMPDTDIVWLYASIPVSSQLPNDIPYQIIDYCFIPNEDYLLELNDSSFIALENLAYTQLGYEMAHLNHNNVASSNIGHIRMYRDSTELSLQGVPGIKISAFQFTKTATTFTDANGDYSFGTDFRTNFLTCYTLTFKNSKDFTIFSNVPGIPAYTFLGMGSSLPSETINCDDTAMWRRAAVNCITYKYYNDCIEDNILPPPEQLMIWESNLIASSATCMFYQMRGNAYLFNTNYDLQNFFLNIYIGLPANFILFLAEDILPDIVFGTRDHNYADLVNVVTHELSHASHFSKVGPSYWIPYVEYIISYLGYGDGSGRNADICGIGEMWGYAMGLINEKTYKGESVPNGMRRIANWINYGIYIDLINSSYFTKADIFDCMRKNTTSFSSLVYNLYLKHPEAYSLIDSLFSANNINYTKPENMEEILIEATTINQPMVFECMNATLQNVIIHNDFELRASDYILINRPLFIEGSLDFYLHF